MKILQSIFLTLVFHGTATLSVLYAQNTVDEEPVRFSFQIISLNDSIRDAFYYSDGTFQPVFITNSNFTRLYDYHGPKPLALYRRVKNPEGSGFEPFAVWHGSKTARGGRHYMLLVSKFEDTFKISAFDHTANAAKENLALFFNATEEPLKIFARGLEFELDDFSSKAIVVPVNEDGVFEAAIVTESGLVFRGRLKMPHGEQGLYFVRPSSVSNNQVAIKRIRNPRRTPVAD